MNNNNTSNLNLDKPVIFTKKVNNNSKIIPLNLTKDNLGYVRHFPPANKEWSNSIYSYNSNYIKSLPVADKNLTEIVKSYFNLFSSNEEKLTSRRMRLRFRRLSVNKIFVSKAELKHTNSKVIITLYVYNEEKLFITNKLNMLISMFVKDDLKSKSSEDRPLSFKQKSYFTKENLSSIMKEINEDKSLIINNIDENGIFNIHKDRLYYEIMKKIYEKELMTFTYYKLLLDINNSKFEDNFLLKLGELISKIYKKKVEFNIVNLKHLYLNSDIFSQAIALKLKNRKNNVLKVLKSSLNIIELPDINKIVEKSSTSKIKQPLITKNLKINSILDNSINNKDGLNQLLLDILPNADNLVKEKEEAVLTIDNGPSSTDTYTTSNIENIVLNSLKNKAIGGVRLEAKGRLTRRFTASRSVFKVKWIGSLKNIDSSYKGLSSVMLRGHLKPNLQYSAISSKTRNGAFGLKGWVSSK